MARNYAAIFTAIWQDTDWRALPAAPQRTYLMLVSQPNISAAGMLPLTVRRWATMSSDTSSASIRADLDRLHAARLIVLDEGTEEVLVRSFVRHDNGYSNPRRQPSIRDAARDIVSPGLRRVLAAELARLGLPGDWLPEDPDPTPTPEPDRHSDRHSESSPPDPVGNSVDNGKVLVDSHSDRQSDCDRRVPLTTTHNPLTTTQEPLAADAAILDAELVFVEPTPPTPSTAIDAAPNAGTITAQWIDYCTSKQVKLPKNLIGRYARGIKSALDQGFHPDLVKHALAAMLADRHASHPHMLDSYLVRAQQGRPGRQRTATPGEETAHRLASGDAQVIDLVARFFDREVS